MPASIGKMVTLCGIVVIPLAITPTGSRIDPHDPWVVTQWQWIQRALRQEQDATPVTINPILFYLGILLSVIGYGTARGEDRGTSHAGAGKSCTNSKEDLHAIFMSAISPSPPRPTRCASCLRGMAPWTPSDC